MRHLFQACPQQVRQDAEIVAVLPGCVQEFSRRATSGRQRNIGEGNGAEGIGARAAKAGLGQNRCRHILRLE